MPSSAKAGTASVVVSRPELQVIGTAPAASLMPIRAIESVVRLSQLKVADAVDYAVDNGAHVITMSLGGMWSLSLWMAIERAVAADVLVLAAAGNCVDVVVWPARFDSCIAVAGVDSRDAPWVGSCRGPSVDISAPAQNVFRAHAQTMGVGQGQGTSFAVALTAGVAACWLAHHGRAHLISQARARGESLQAMFRRLLKATTRRPACPWDAHLMGPGVADAEQLLRAPFDLGRETEGPVPPPRVPAPQRSLQALALEVTGDPLAASEDDLLRNGGEISLELLRAAARRKSNLEGAAAPPASERIARLLGQRRSAPAVVRPAETLDPVGREKLRRLRGAIAARQHIAEGGSQESASKLESAGEVELSAEQTDAVLTRVMELAKSLPARERGDPQAFAAALNTFARHAPSALEKLTGTGGPATLSRNDQAAIEAIIIADGSRPSFLIEGDKPPLNHPFMGSWQAAIAANEEAIAPIVAAVGRIQPSSGHNSRYMGTGFLVDRDKGLVLTNYHVFDSAQTDWGVQMVETGNGVTKVVDPLEIDFNGEANTFATNRFRIVEVRRHAKSGSGFGSLDAVTMRIEPIGSESRLPAQAVRFDRSVATFQKASSGNLCTIGFPGPPKHDDPSGRVDWNFVVKTLFGDLFGVKRFAPGRITMQPGGVARDPLRTVFGHDATTFRGASGSLVCAWGLAEKPVIGLHFAGDTEIGNYALTVAQVADQLSALGVPV